jgi:NTP pyrophosphatase (non-canonical NTP hydrolase)
MLANDYQKSTAETAIYGKTATNAVRMLNSYNTERLLSMFYVVTKLNGEAGECAELVAKALRDDNGKFTAQRKNALIAELGDVLWYCSQLATELGVSLSSVMHENLNKLQSRKERDVLHGSGSDR